jgi:hypothetical protein
MTTAPSIYAELIPPEDALPEPTGEGTHVEQIVILRIVTEGPIGEPNPGNWNWDALLLINPEKGESATVRRVTQPKRINLTAGPAR